LELKNILDLTFEDRSHILGVKVFLGK